MFLNGLCHQGKQVDSKAWMNFKAVFHHQLASGAYRMLNSIVPKVPDLMGHGSGLTIKLEGLGQV